MVFWQNLTFLEEAFQGRQNSSPSLVSVLSGSAGLWERSEDSEEWGSQLGDLHSTEHVLRMDHPFLRGLSRDSKNEFIVRKQK